MDSLSDNGFSTIARTATSLKTIMVNNTPDLSEDSIIELRKSRPSLNILRSVIKPSDTKDDGLRMPLPTVAVVERIYKKNKKGKKKKK